MMLTLAGLLFYPRPAAARVFVSGEKRRAEVTERMACALREQTLGFGIAASILGDCELP